MTSPTPTDETFEAVLTREFKHLGADCPVSEHAILAAHLADKERAVGEAEDAGYRRGLKTAGREVEHARRLQEMYLNAHAGDPVSMEIVACKHLRRKDKGR